MGCADVLDTGEQAETVAEAQQLREPLRKENVETSTATGKSCSFCFIVF